MAKADRFGAGFIVFGVAGAFLGCKPNAFPQDVLGTFTTVARSEDNVVTQDVVVAAKSMSMAGTTPVAAIFEAVTCEGPVCSFKSTAGCEGTLTRAGDGRLDIAAKGSCEALSGTWLAATAAAARKKEIEANIAADIAKRKLVAVKPSIVLGSTFLDHPRAVPLKAFDSDKTTGWQARSDLRGAGEWLEARFDQPIRLRKISLTTGFDSVTKQWGDLFTANSHAKKIQVIADEKLVTEVSVGETQRTIEIGDINVTAKKVRLLFSEVWSGSKWPDMCVSNVDFTALAYDDAEAGKLMTMGPPRLQLLPGQVTPKDTSGDTTWAFIAAQTVCESCVHRAMLAKGCQATKITDSNWTESCSYAFVAALLSCESACRD